MAKVVFNVLSDRGHCPEGEIRGDFAAYAIKSLGRWYLVDFGRR
jgi:hypothetical protein